MADKNHSPITVSLVLLQFKPASMKKKSIGLVSFQWGEQQITVAPAVALETRIQGTLLAANRLFKAVQFQPFPVLSGGRLEAFCCLDCEGNCNIGLGKD